MYLRLEFKEITFQSVQMKCGRGMFKIVLLHFVQNAGLSCKHITPECVSPLHINEKMNNVENL